MSAVFYCQLFLSVSLIRPQGESWFAQWHSSQDTLHPAPVNSCQQSLCMLSFIVSYFSLSLLSDHREKADLPSGIQTRILPILPQLIAVSNHYVCCLLLSVISVSLIRPHGESWFTQWHLSQDAPRPAPVNSCHQSLCMLSFIVS